MVVTTSDAVAALSLTALHSMRAITAGALSATALRPMCVAIRMTVQVNRPGTEVMIAEAAPFT